MEKNKKTGESLNKNRLFNEEEALSAISRGVNILKRNLSQDFFVMEQEYDIDPKYIVSLCSNSEGIAMEGMGTDRQTALNDLFHQMTEFGVLMSVIKEEDL